MKPVLVLALGNALAGDDGIGCAVAAAAADDEAIAAAADLLCAGTDLFRHAHQLTGRRRIIIVDAALTEGDDTRVRSLPHPPPSAEQRSYAHALDPVAAVSLLRSLDPALLAADTWWLLIDVPRIGLTHRLSPAAAARVPEALAALRQLVLGPAAPPN